jgi:hypothetical protein
MKSEKPKKKKKKKVDEVVKVRSTKKDNPFAFDPGALLEKAVADDLNPGAIDDLDDAWLPRPPNIFTFLTSRKFLSLDPFPMQVKILTELFEQYCPKCTDMDFWRKVRVDTSLAEIRDRVTFLRFGKCKKCGKTKADFVHEGLFHYKDELVGCAGQRSSKSAMVAGMVAPYHLARFLTLKSPSQTFGLLPGTLLMMTFSALIAEQSRDSLWVPYFQPAIDNSPWYTQLHKFLDEQEKKLGVQLYKKMDTYVFYRHKNLYAHFTGADFRKLRGKTRFFAAIDELGFFDVHNSGRVMQNAHETYTSLSNSLQSIRSAAFKRQKRGEYDIPMGIMANISSPSAIDDEIMSLVNQAQDPEKGKKIYAFHFATHEINPETSYESLREYAKTKGMSFERDFLAIPPLSSNPFIPDKAKLDKIFCHERPPLFQIEEQFKEATHMGEQETYFWAKIKSPQTEKSIPRCVAVDAGETDNSFACAIGFYDNVEDKIVVEQLVELRPDEKRNRVYFPAMLDDFFKIIADSFWVRFFVFDTWGPSSTFQQSLNTYKKGTEADTYSLGWNDFQRIKGGIMGENIMFPRTSYKFGDYKPSEIGEVFKNGGPVPYLKLQLHTCREVGRKLAKPAKGTDDLMRATSLLIHYIYEYKEEFSDYVIGQPMNGRRQGGVPGYVSIRKVGGMGGKSRGGGGGSVSAPSVVAFKSSMRSGGGGGRSGVKR